MIPIVREHHTRRTHRQGGHRGHRTAVPYIARPNDVPIRFNAHKEFVGIPVPNLYAPAAAQDDQRVDKPCSIRRVNIDEVVHPHIRTWTPKTFKSGHFLICFACNRCFLVQIGLAHLLGLMPAENKQSSRPIATSRGRGRRSLRQRESRHNNDGEGRAQRRGRGWVPFQLVGCSSD